MNDTITSVEAYLRTRRPAARFVGRADPARLAHDNAALVAALSRADRRAVDDAQAIEFWRALALCLAFLLIVVVVVR